jgi:hypothetical protein
MIDRDDVLWLLAVAVIVAVVVAVLAFYSTHLERRYASDMEPADGGEDAGPHPDRPPVRYHAQVLAQAAVSYYVSLFLVGLGFVILVDTDGDGRGLAAALIAMVLAVVLFVESRRSRAGMLEQTRALQAEGEERRREGERIRLLQLVSDDDVRNRLVAELLRGEPAAHEPDPQRTTPTPPYAVASE